jgi:hypothetical protein
MYRGYINNPNTYEMTINIEQNIEDNTNNNDSIITYDPNTGEITDVNLRCIAVFYDSEDSPIRWAEAKFVNYDSAANVFSYKFTFTTEDYIDADNRIRIDTGLNNINSNTEFYAHFNNNMKCIIHTLTKQEDSYGLNELDLIIPGLDGYTLTNSYTVVEGLDFFYDYSEIVSSTIVATIDDKTNEEYLTIKGIPVVKYGYFDTEDKAINFCKELVKRKTYIDYAIDVLEDAFGMDFKFFNTYGPSKLFTLDNKLNYINRTNLSITFRLKLNPSYDSNIVNDIIADIKSYIENINQISSIHMPNLITQITNTYRDYLVYFEFIDINGYGPSMQHIYSMQMPSNVVVPEFINVNTLNDGTPDITLIIE